MTCLILAWMVIAEIMFFRGLSFLPLTELPQAHACFIVFLAGSQVMQRGPAGGDMEVDYGLHRRNLKV